MKDLMIIPGNCLPTSKTSWASSRSVSFPKPKIHSTPAFASVHSSFTTQLTFSLSSSQILLTLSPKLFNSSSSFQPLLNFLYFALNLTKYSSLKLSFF